MEDTRIIEDFERSWNHSRKMTNSFLDILPEDKWHFSPHPKFGHISKQFRHMYGVYYCYLQGIVTGNFSFDEKRTAYKGSLEKEELQQALNDLDEKLSLELNKLKRTGLKEFSVTQGKRSYSFISFTNLFLQHEFVHIGLWASMCYLSDIETPELWKKAWEL